MKILDLPLKSNWFLMYQLGIKREEYRAIKPYWVKRLFRGFDVNALLYLIGLVKGEPVDLSPLSGRHLRTPSPMSASVVATPARPSSTG